MNGSQMPPGFRYRDVLRKGRPVHRMPDTFSIRHPAMPLSRRAKIFSPFDALKGFREALAAEEAAQEETARDTIAERCDMCTRFYIDISDKELQEIVAAAQDSALAEKFMRAGSPMASSGEIRPTDVVPAIAMSRSGHRSVFPMKWGFHVPGLHKPDAVSMLLNARSETACEKRTFRDSWEKHRCILPASYYFEWEHFLSPDGKKKTGRKFAIQPKGASTTWLCGLYRMEAGFPHFVVLTRPPAKDIAFIHDRMPVILPKQLVDQWIDPSADPARIIRQSLDDLVFEAAE